MTAAADWTAWTCRVRLRAAGAGGAPVTRLAVDPVRCIGHGLCAELLLEALVLDQWDYPLVTADVPADLLRRARRTAATCPTRALRLVGA